MEFQGTKAKISRYASVLHSLLELNQWWDELPPHDRFVVAHTNRLVSTCEKLLLQEVHMWKSASQVATLLNKAANNYGNNSNIAGNYQNNDEK